VFLVGHVCRIIPPRAWFPLKIPMLGRQHGMVVLVLSVAVSDEEDLVWVQMYQDVVSR
jgi:hypothetical protein